MKMVSKSMTLGDFFDRQDAFEIPDWQRDYVWDAARRQKLIDTILSGWTLPKFYFWIPSAGSASQVVDGQQRLTTIARFHANKDFLSPDIMNKFDLSGRYYKNLSPDHQKAFSVFSIQYDEITDATPNEIKEFFQRLQHGVQLTGFERMNAVDSRLRDFCKSMATHPFFRNSLSFADRRKSHMAIVARVMAIELCGRRTSLRSDSLIQLFEDNRDFSYTSEPAIRIGLTLDYLARVFPEKSPALNDRSFIQSVITIASVLAFKENGLGHEQAFGAFVRRFFDKLSQLDEDDVSPNTKLYKDFKKTIQRNTLDEAEVRHDIMMQIMQADTPFLASLIGYSGTGRAFSALLRDRASRLWGVVAPSSFTEMLANHLTSIANPLIRKNTINSYGALYEGRQAPLDADGNLTPDAVAVASLLRISCTEMEEAIPSLKGDMIYTDVLKKTNPALAKEMRQKRIFTLSALEARQEFEFSAQDRAHIIAVFHDEHSLRSTRDSAIVQSVDTAIGLCPPPRPGLAATNGQKALAHANAQHVPA